MHPLESHLHAVTRRTFLKNSGVGLGAMALNSLLTESLFAAPSTAANPLSAQRTARTIKENAPD